MRSDPRFPAAAAVLVLIVAACAPTSTSAEQTSPTPAPASSDAPPTAARLCPEAGFTSTREFPVGSVTRLVRIHVPQAEATFPRPLVLAFHGFTGSPGDIEGTSGLSSKADDEGFVVAYPAGRGLPPRWDTAGDTDTAFVAALIDALVAEGCVDPDHVYATGFSMGGAMSVTVGCRLADRFAAIGLVSAPYGPEWVPDCTPSEPVPAIAFHGLADPSVPYAGGPTGEPGGNDLGLPPVIAVENWAAGWATANGCSSEPVAQPPVGQASPLFWDECAAPVHLYPVNGLGHAWPGGVREAETASGLSATDLIWEFFSGFAN